MDVFGSYGMANSKQQRHAKGKNSHGGEQWDSSSITI